MTIYGHNLGSLKRENNECICNGEKTKLHRIKIVAFLTLHMWCYDAKYISSFFRLFVFLQLYIKTCFTTPVDKSSSQDAFFIVTAIICNRKTDKYRVPKHSSFIISIWRYSLSYWREEVFVMLFFVNLFGHFLQKGRI